MSENKLLDRLTTSDPPPHPGRVVASLIHERSWSQGDLAAVLGVSRQTANYLCTGRQGISVKMAIRLAGVFECDPYVWLEAWGAYRVQEIVRAEARL